MAKNKSKQCKHNLAHLISFTKKNDFFEGLKPSTIVYWCRCCGSIGIPFRNRRKDYDYWMDELQIEWHHPDINRDIYTPRTHFLKQKE